MLIQILIGSALICVSIFTTIAFFSAASMTISATDDWLQAGMKRFRAMIAVFGVVLCLLAALSVAIWLWAITFIWVGEFDNVEEAAYFSIVSFTTLGFGDVIISKDWRLLSGMLAANGFLLFSIATAFLIDSLVHIRDTQQPRKKQQD